MTITEFLLARIADDETRAAAASPGSWQVAGTEWAGDWMQTGEVFTDAGHDVTGPDTYGPDCTYLVAFQPARVLAECEAKRRIVELHSEADGRVDPRDGCRACLTDREGYSDDWQPDAWPCLTLCALAAVYADHPDYDPEWTPRA